MTQGKDNKGPKPITIEIDDEEFTVDEKTKTLTELLDLVDLEPDESYLIELHGNGNQEPHKDADGEIKLHPGIRFVTGDRGTAPVA